jgi:glycosyltransferase involved in cell wall biosynthesis
VPWLSTVHDLNPWTLGHSMKRVYFRFLVKPFFRGARIRFTVSEFSREELGRWAGLPPESIRLAHNAIDPAFASPPEDTTILEDHSLEPDRYFLVLSNPKPHKNVSGLVRAYAGYREEAAGNGRSPLPLAVNVAGYEDRPGIVPLGPVAGPAATRLLGSARAFFAPSRYEGFGLPPLEAAYLGTPVVVSAIPPHREALSPFDPGEVHWIDPLDTTSWIRAFHLAEEGALERPRPESRRRAAEEFSVSRLGATMDRAYRDVLGGADYAGGARQGRLSGTMRGSRDE